MFWGDRFLQGRRTRSGARLVDRGPHKEDLTPQEMARRGEEAMRQYAAQQKK
jgi:hypothetical protein